MKDWPYTDARERYGKDMEFTTLVDTMRAMLYRVQFSPTELRQAAMLACILEENLKPPQPMVLYPDGRFEQLPRKPEE